MKYIKRNICGIEIHDEDIRIHESGLKNCLNQLCLLSGSTYDGRIASIKHITNRKGLVPLYVNSDIIFVSTKNIREYDAVFINYLRILSFRALDNNNIQVVFDDLEELKITTSYNRFFRQCRLVESILGVTE